MIIAAVLAEGSTAGGDNWEVVLDAVGRSSPADERTWSAGEPGHRVSRWPVGDLVEERKGCHATIRLPNAWSAVGATTYQSLFDLVWNNVFMRNEYSCSGTDEQRRAECAEAGPVRVDGVALHYWADESDEEFLDDIEANCQSMAGMLTVKRLDRRFTAIGTCLAFSELLSNVLWLHGFAKNPECSTLAWANTTGQLLAPVPQIFDDLAAAQEPRMLVPCWGFAGTGEIAKKPFPDREQDVTRKFGKRGQGTRDPRSVFYDHYVSRIGINSATGVFYDPSYGEGPYATIAEIYAGMSGYRAKYMNYSDTANQDNGALFFSKQVAP